MRVVDAGGQPVEGARVEVGSFFPTEVDAQCDFPESFRMVTADAAGNYLFQGLGPQACTLTPLVEHNTLADPTTPPAFLPKVAVLPASGSVRIDLAERSGPASLRVSKDRSVLNVYLLEGDVAAPTTWRELEALEPRALSQGLSSEEAAVEADRAFSRKPHLDFHRLPLGRYTLIVTKPVRQGNGGASVLRLPVDLTGPGLQQVRVEFSGNEPAILYRHTGR